MDIYLVLSYWIFQPYAWIILGLSIVIIDIFFLGFVLLPFGISSLLIAALIFCDQRMVWGELVLFETWRDILLYFALLSLVSLGVIKLLVKMSNKGNVDINEY